MKIFVRARPRSHQESVEKIDETHYIVSVKEPPVNGLANKGIIKVLANHFAVAPTQIEIVSGFTSRNKLINIDK